MKLLAESAIVIAAAVAVAASGVANKPTKPTAVSPPIANTSPEAAAPPAATIGSGDLSQVEVPPLREAEPDGAAALQPSGAVALFTQPPPTEPPVVCASCAPAPARTAARTYQPVYQQQYQQVQPRRRVFNGRFRRW